MPILTPANIAAAGAQSVVDQLKWLINARRRGRYDGDLDDAYGRGLLAYSVIKQGAPDPAALARALGAANRALALALNEAYEDAEREATYPWDLHSLWIRSRDADKAAQRYEDGARLHRVLNAAAVGDVTVNVVGMQVGICIDGVEILSRSWLDPDFRSTSDVQLEKNLECGVERARFILVTDPELMAEIDELESRINYYQKRAAELRASDEPQGWETWEEYEYSLPEMWHKLDLLYGREVDEHWDHECVGDPGASWCETCVEWAATEAAERLSFPRSEVRAALDSDDDFS